MAPLRGICNPDSGAVGVSAPAARTADDIALLWLPIGYTGPTSPVIRIYRKNITPTQNGEFLDDCDENMYCMDGSSVWI